MLHLHSLKCSELKGSDVDNVDPAVCMHWNSPVCFQLQAGAINHLVVGRTQQISVVAYSQQPAPTCGGGYHLYNGGLCTELTQNVHYNYTQITPEHPLFWKRQAEKLFLFELNPPHRLT